MRREEPKYSVKPPGAVFWKCGLSHNRVLSLLDRGSITPNWLICPHGESFRAKPISDLPIRTATDTNLVLTPQQTSTFSSTKESNAMDSYEAIERLAKLKEQGYLSENEFATEKTRILNSFDRSSHSPTNVVGNGSPSTSVDEGVHPSLIAGGYVCTFLIAIVGLILGIIILVSGNQYQKGHGIAITAMSALMMFVSFLILVAANA